MGLNTKKVKVTLLILLIAITLIGCESKNFTIKIEYDIFSGDVLGAGEYEEGTKVVLVADPRIGYEVKHWMKDGEIIGEDEELEVVVENDLNIELFFEKQTYEVELVSNDSDKGKVNGSGIYLSGKTIDLIATSKKGYKFDGWYDEDDLISTEKKLTYTIKNDVKLEARFSLAKEVDIKLTTNEPNAVIDTQVLDENNNPKEVVREQEKVKVWINNFSAHDVGSDIRDYLNFQYKGLYINGERVTNDFTYEFTAEEDVVIQARFEPISLSNIRVDESINQNILDKIEKPEVYDFVLSSPNKSYILAIAESVAYILSQDGEKVFNAFELEMSYDPNYKQYYKIHWLENEDGFYYYDSESKNKKDNNLINIQYIDATQKIIEIPNVRGSSRVGYETSLNPVNISSSSNWFGFVLEDFYRGVLEKDIIGMGMVNVDTHETYFKKLDHRYSIGEWSETFSGSYIFSEDSKKVLYSYYCGTGYIDLESLIDHKISDSIIQDTIGIYPLKYEDDRVVFYAGPYIWHEYFQHLFVLDIQTGELSIVNYNFTNSYSTYKTYENTSLEGVSQLGVVYANSPVKKDASEIEIGSYLINEEPVSYESSSIEESINNLRNHYKTKENGEIYLSVFDKFSNMIKNSYSSVYEPEILYNIKLETEKRFLKDVEVDSEGNHFVLLETRGSKNDSIILFIDEQGEHEKIYEYSGDLGLLGIDEERIVIAENIGQGYKIKLVER